MELLRYLAVNKNVNHICKWQFGEGLYPTQEKVLKDILFSKAKRIMWSASTRYGKTRTLCKTMLLYIMFNSNINVQVIAPSYEIADPIRNYIWELGLKSPIIRDLIDVSTDGGIDRLKKEVTKRKVTFKNGSMFQVLSAHGDAMRLMGKGARGNVIQNNNNNNTINIGGIIWIDERAMIEPEAERTINRMLMDNPATKLIETLNPWSKANRAWQHWVDWKLKMEQGDEEYKVYHTPASVGVEEGRFSAETMNEMIREYSDDPIAYEVLFNSNFPDDEEKGLIPYAHIERAYNKVVQPNTQIKLKIAGLDVAEAGRDRTVLTTGYIDTHDNYIVQNIFDWHKSDTMQTVSEVTRHIDNNTIINIDSNGTGKGVFDRLVELGYKANGIKVGTSASYQLRSRFLNKKSELCWRLKQIFADDRIVIPKQPRLIRELNIIQYEITSAGKVIIRDSKNSKDIKYDKSPDFFDSLYLFTSLSEVAKTQTASVGRVPRPIENASRQAKSFFNSTRYHGRIM